MKQFKLTGGARIGRANATFPFATLKVTANKLELNASIIGNLVFAPQDIISIESYNEMGKGVKINHRVDNYNEKVVFWTSKDPTKVITEIKETGFLDNVNSNIVITDREIIARQIMGGFPLKKSVTIGAVVVWNALFLTDIYQFFIGRSGDFPIGIGITTALGLVLITAIMALLSEPFRRLILKEGRELDDIKRFLYFTIFVCGILFLAFTQMGNLAQ